MKTMTFIPPEGPELREQRNDVPPLEELRAIIGGGWAEHVSVLYNGRPAHMFVDEEGSRKGLPVNLRATNIYRAYAQSRGIPNPHFIVGPALLFEGFSSSEF
jgi:hypothetical protein